MGARRQLGSRLGQLERGNRAVGKAVVGHMALWW